MGWTVLLSQRWALIHHRTGHILSIKRSSLLFLSISKGFKIPSCIWLHQAPETLRFSPLHSYHSKSLQEKSSLNHPESLLKHSYWGFLDQADFRLDLLILRTCFLLVILMFSLLRQNITSWCHFKKQPVPALWTPVTTESWSQSFLLSKNIRLLRSL